MAKKDEFLMLLETLTPKTGVGGYWWSVKLDGMLAMWDGGWSRGRKKSEVWWANMGNKDRRADVCTGLWSRLGNVIHAPDWWLDMLPRGFCLVGELYRPGWFRQEILSVTRSLDAGNRWRDVGFYITEWVPWREVQRPRMLSWLKSYPAGVGVVNGIPVSELYHDAGSQESVSGIQNQDSGIKTGYMWHSFRDSYQGLVSGPVFSGRSVILCSNMQSEEGFLGIGCPKSGIRLSNQGPGSRFQIPGVSHEVGIREGQLQIMAQGVLPLPYKGAMAELEMWMQRVERRGGEGVVVRNPDKYYCCTRSGDVLKYKVERSGVDTVVGVTAGLGRHSGRVGALVLESGLKLSGMTDAERDLGPEYWIGRKVRYKYRDTTSAGVPVEARYEGVES